MRGRSRASSINSSSKKILDNKNDIDPELSHIICDFREQMQTVVPAYKTGKFKKIMNEILNNPYVKDTIRPKQNSQKRILTVTKSSNSVTRSKEDAIFNVEDAVEDPFTYESQTQDQLKSNKIDLKKSEKKPEKVFSLKPLSKKKSVGSIKPLRVDPESRLSKRNASDIRRERYTRDLRESSVSSCDSSARSHLSSRKLVPQSQDMLSQNTSLVKSQLDTPPKERAKAKRLRQFRKSVEKGKRSNDTIPVTNENSKLKDPNLGKPLVLTTSENEKENKNNQDIDDISSQQVRQSIRNRKEKRRNRRKEKDLSSDEGDDIALPRSKRILKPKSPTTQSSIGSTLASTTQLTQLNARSEMPNQKTPGQKTSLANAVTPKNIEGLATTVTPSKSILKIPKDYTVNLPTEKTPSRISFGANQVKEIKIPSTGSSTDTSPSQSQVFRPTTPTQNVLPQPPNDEPSNGVPEKRIESKDTEFIDKTQSSIRVNFNTQIPSIPSTQTTIESENSPLISGPRNVLISEPPTREPSTATQNADKFLNALDGDIFSAEKKAPQKIYKSVVNSDPSQASNGQSTSGLSSGISCSTGTAVGQPLGATQSESRKRKRSEEGDDDVEFPVSKKAFLASMETMQKSIIETMQTMVISTIQAEVNKMHSKLESKIDSISTISKLELNSFRSELESNRRAMEETTKGLLEHTNSILKRSREGEPQPMEIPDKMTENAPQFESTRQTEEKKILSPQTSKTQTDFMPKVALNDDKFTEDEDLIEDVHSSELDKMPDDRDLICPETNDVPRDMDEDDIVLSSGDEDFETPKSSPKKLEKGANCSRQLNLESDSDEDKPKLRIKRKQRVPPGLREEKQSSDGDFDDDDTTLIGDDFQATITPKKSANMSEVQSKVTKNDGKCSEEEDELEAFLNEETQANPGLHQTGKNTGIPKTLDLIGTLGSVKQKSKTQAADLNSSNQDMNESQTSVGLFDQSETESHFDTAPENLQLPVSMGNPGDSQKELSEKERNEIKNVMSSTKSASDKPKSEIDITEDVSDFDIENDLETMLNDSKLVENAMKKVAQSTPARPRGSPRKKIKPEKVDAIPEEPESVEEIPNGTPQNEINPTKSADFTTTLDVPTIEHAWKLPKTSGNRTQYAGKKYVIAFSQLSANQKKSTKRFCERIDGIHTSSINEHTTHLVTSINSSRTDDYCYKSDDVFAQRTLKYFQALIQGIWIVSYDWVEMSMQMTEGCANEEYYEVNGDVDSKRTDAPAKARKHKREGQFGILAKYAFYCQPPFSPVMPKPTIYSLITKAGGKVFNDYDHLNSSKRYGLSPMILLHEKDEQTQPTSKRFDGHVCVERDWLIDSLCCFKVRKLDKYLHG